MAIGHYPTVLTQPIATIRPQRNHQQIEALQATLQRSQAQLQTLKA